LTSHVFIAIICFIMPSPDFANPMRPEEFPDIFRQVVREIGGLVMVKTAAVEDMETQLLAIPDSELMIVQRRSHFSRADIANRVARDFSTVKDGQRQGSSRASSLQS
jgi:hypothetical protein